MQGQSLIQWKAIAAREAATGVVVAAWLFLLWQLWLLSQGNELEAYGVGLGYIDRAFDWIVVSAIPAFDFVLSICEFSASSDMLEKLLANFAMWSIMITAMMLPLVLPLFKNDDNKTYVRAPKIAIGYFVVWVAAACIFAIVHTQLQVHLLVSDEMVLTNIPLGLTIILLAVLYRFSKQGIQARRICARHMQTLTYQAPDDRPFAKGMQLGVMCFKCNWMTMLVMLVFGLMNILAMAALTALMIWDRRSY